MRDELAEARVRAATHIFQNVRPYNPMVSAVCYRCNLALPQGPILSIGPGGLPPCNNMPLYGEGPGLIRG